MTVYADVLFAVNFIMDWVILWAVAKLSRQRVKKRRLALGALCMALPYCLLIIGVSYNAVISLLSSVLILALGVIAALRPSGVKKFFTQMALGYAAAFAIGGLGLALFYLTDIPFTALAAVKTLSWKLVLACVLGSYAAVKITVRVTEHIAIKRQMICQVNIYIGESDVNFQALVDTGHSLRDPISQAPVIIAEFELIKPFLPDGLKNLFYENGENDLTRLIQNTDGSAFYQRLRMIPFNSLGRANGMLIGFKPDRVAVGKETPVPRSDVVIGIYNNRLTRDGRYRGLLAPELAA